MSAADPGHHSSEDQKTAVLLASATKSDRLDCINSDDAARRQVAASIEIQRHYRGYRTRCQLKHHHITTDDLNAGVHVDQNNEVDVKSLYESYCVAITQQGKQPATFEIFLASYNEHVEEDEGVRDVQILTVTNSRLDGEQKGPSSDHEAAAIIQRAWRRHIDIQVYRYYRDLINFRQRGDPHLMLKCINPKEADFLDAAAGIHIKFRLAGERFPPNIYYKIFTHRPVVDMCANSPKDYTKAGCKRRVMKDLHNKSGRGHHVSDDQSGWYERRENNGWRLVSDRLIQHVTVDPVTWETSQTKTKFHHDKLTRRQDVERKRRLKKIEWMKQMYREGMMKTRVTDKETIQLIEGAAAGMVAAVEEEGPDAVKEWEVDELLEWTTTLSFDDYIDSWKGMGTSAKSEAMIENRNLESYRQYLEMQSLKAYHSETRARLLGGHHDDPYMLSLTPGGANVTNTSAHQSHATPATTPGGVVA